MPALQGDFAIFGLRAEFNHFGEMGEGTIGGGGCFKIIMGIPGTISNMFRWFDEF
jgi:hypothetical protein